MKVSFDLDSVLIFVGILSVLGLANGVLTLHLENLHIQAILNSLLPGLLTARFSIQGKLNKNKNGDVSRPS
ncbi:hypothetical protein V7128_17695 [Neobacillus vireti]|uniref:hypothetical protein n=1 Tax=Neobacillus vireti TaxID=220686 RepID=UPI003000D671